MDLDFREIAMLSVGDLDQIAERFPMRSRTGKAIRRAAWIARVEYVFGTAQKQQCVLSQIALGNRTTADLIHSTGLRRVDVTATVTALMMEGYVFERLEAPRTDYRGGRPCRCFYLTEKGETWYESRLIQEVSNSEIN